MGIFGADPATQLWIAARYLQAFSLVAAALVPKRSLGTAGIMAVYALTFGLVLLSVFQFDLFPHCYLEETGLTAFKKISELVIIGLLLAALFLLFGKKKEFEPRSLHLAAGSILVTVLSELSFTIYTDVYGLANMLGHLLKVAAFYLIYKAIIETAFKKPYLLLAYDLRESEKLYRDLFNSITDFILTHDLEAGSCPSHRWPPKALDTNLANCLPVN